MRNLKRIFFLVLIIISLPAFTQEKADDFDIVGRCIRYPHYFKPWKITYSLGFSMVRPPRDLLENAIQAPLVDFRAVMGLPYHFSADGYISTIVVSNNFGLGMRYNVMIHRFSANVGADITYSYGFLHQGGFDNTASAITFYPNLSAGYRIANYTFTVKGDINWLLSSSSNTGENEVNHYKNFFNGGSIAVYVEQRLWKNKVFVIGFKDNYIKSYWPTWMLFSTFDRYYHIPELSFSWVL